MAVYTIGAVLAGSEVDPCCCAPEDCCLYPNPGILSIGDPPLNYPYTDSPDVLYVTAGPLVLEPFTRVIEPDYSGFKWLGPTYPVEFEGEILYYATWEIAPQVSESPFWELSSGSGGIYGNAFCTCLIGNYTDGTIAGPAMIEDGFPETLTVNGVDSILRTNNCTWTGAKSGGGTWRLFYDGIAGDLGNFKFELNGVDKTDPQSSPVGTYGADTIA